MAVRPQPQEHGNRVWSFEDLKKQKTSGLGFFKTLKTWWISWNNWLRNTKKFPIFAFYYLFFLRFTTVNKVNMLFIEHMPVIKYFEIFLISCLFEVM